MTIENKIDEEMESISDETKKLELKVYTEPKITKIGAMQRVTLGGSPGVGDSGGSATEIPFS